MVRSARHFVIENAIVEEKDLLGGRGYEITLLRDREEVFSTRAIFAPWRSGSLAQVVGKRDEKGEEERLDKSLIIMKQVAMNLIVSFSPAWNPQNTNSDHPSRVSCRFGPKYWRYYPATYLD